MADEHEPGSSGERPWWGQPYGEAGPPAPHDPSDTPSDTPGSALGGPPGGGPAGADAPRDEALHPTQPTPTSYLSAYPSSHPTAPFGPPVGPPPTSTLVLPHDASAPRHRVGYALLVAVVALLAAGGGAAAGVHVGRHDGTTHTTYSVTPAASSTGGGSSASGSIEAVAKAVQPAVVSVVEKTSDEEGEGSGIVIDGANGYVLTNNHVVSLVRSSDASLTVTTSDGRSAPATVVGGDATADIAVIKVGLDNLTQARLGDSSKVVVGQTVVAFGSPLGLQGSVTSGIISALDRPVSTSDSSGQSSAPQATIDALQTDAAINPGNSGGPLVDLSGAVIGVNSAIASVSQSSGLGGQGGESGNIGVGFSIPIDEAMYTADQLIKTGHAVHAVIGVSLQPDTTGSDTAGAVVGQVTADGPAAKAGIKPGDVIVAVDGKDIPDADTAIVAIRANHKPGDVVRVTVSRGGSQQTFSVTLGASDPS